MANPLYTSRSEDKRTIAIPERKPMSRKKKIVLSVVLAGGAALAAASSYVGCEIYRAHKAIGSLQEGLENTELSPLEDLHLF